MIIYGSELALRYKADIREKVNKYKEEGKRIPKLGVILVGDNPASVSYVKGKRKACEDTGMAFELKELKDTVSQDELIAEIEKWNDDETIDGILVQLPLPEGIDENAVIEHIDHKKDVDGLTSYNAGKLFLGEDGFVPCTPLGVMAILKEMNVDLEGKNAVVIGRSSLVGLPVSKLLLNKHATVTVCHSRTKNLKEIASRADVLVVAIGKARFINHEYVKEGAFVIDVGVNRVDGKLCGDVDFDDVIDKVSMITPVPKGVGPMTIAMLMNNVLKAYEER
ncbi:MAG: bifunctional methylenetetrahydrofolate dehydrogenase/methenyltetrahydrofolate cyclohydrolase FolD [Firmicutes bacterium]|nr:bifunctional methylenetetrahydrofolate dehydrogenase/methenyltetrahydrofolate cyclohydrolase FolD [Bacillota bacterium]MDY3092158.1 bifunctional methylenetetrahydrofolate dehydrogenase/methenyltetrahydrofolate cyclohydrolase FolD [Erysipelotrichaceae bacterium]